MEAVLFYYKEIDKALKKLIAKEVLIVFSLILVSGLVALFIALPYNYLLDMEVDKWRTSFEETRMNIKRLRGPYVNKKNYQSAVAISFLNWRYRNRLNREPNNFQLRNDLELYLERNKYRMWEYLELSIKPSSVSSRSWDTFKPDSKEFFAKYYKVNNQTDLERFVSKNSITSRNQADFNKAESLGSESDYKQNMLGDVLKSRTKKYIFLEDAPHFLGTIFLIITTILYVGRLMYWAVKTLRE